MTLVTVHPIDHKTSLIKGDGINLTITTIMVDSYLKARQDIIQLGESGAINKWIGEEKVERRKIGLSTKTHTKPHHYGTSTEAACGVHNGVEGNIQQEVVWYTLSRHEVTCPECLEALGEK